MPKNEKMRVSQFTILVALYTVGTSILIAPHMSAYFGKQDGWISLILNLAIGLFVIFFYNKMARAFQQKSFFQYMTDTIGSWGCKIVSLLFFIYCFVLIAILIREIGDFATVQLYPDTPLDTIIALFIVITIIGAKYGIETIGRAAELMFPWFIILLFILLLSLIPQMKIENLSPMFSVGVKPILLASYAHLGTPYFQLFLFLILIPYVNDSEKTGKAFFIGVIFGGIVILIITLVALLVLGNESTSRLLFPSYTMAKTIEIANIIERIEAFLASIWFISIYIKIVITFFCAILFLKNAFNLQENDFLIFPLGLFILFLSVYISPSIIHYNTFIAKIWTPYAGTHGVLIPFLLFLIHWMKNRKKSREQNG